MYRKITVAAMKILCAALSLLLALSGCALFDGGGEQDGESPGHQRLTVENTGLLLSDEEKTEAATLLCETAERFLLFTDGFVPDEEQRTELREFIKGELLPLIGEAGVGLEGIKRANADAMRTLTLMEAGGDRFSALRSGYFDLLADLGSKALGTLLYRFTLYSLDLMAERAAQRYEEYGYAWYQKDAAEYTRLSLDMKGLLGEKAFSDALGILFFTSTLSSGALGAEDGALPLRDAKELEVLLRCQRQKLHKDALTAPQWELTFAVLFKVFLEDVRIPEELSALEKGELSALRECPAYAKELGGIMPYLTDLYVSVTERMNEEEIETLLCGGENAARRLAALAAECTEPLLRLIDAVKAMELSSSLEAEAISSAGYGEAFNAYARERSQIETEAFCALLGDFAAGKCSLDDLRAALENLSFASAPYITFVYFGVGEEELQ